jgi:hypothetical protein
MHDRFMTSVYRNNTQTPGYRNGLEFSGLCGLEQPNFSVVGCDNAYFTRLVPTFREKITLPLTGLKIKLTNEQIDNNKHELSFKSEGTSSRVRDRRSGV